MLIVRPLLTVLFALPLLAASSGASAERDLLDAAFRSYFVGSEVTSVASADLNHDGRKDLVVGNIVATSILMNSTQGFSAGVSLASSASERGVLLSDLDDDGNLDIVVAHSETNAFLAYLGNGDGTFDAPQSFATAAGPVAAVAADFNEDGVQDVAVACEGANRVAIHLGQGNGMFGAGLNYLAGTSPRAVLAADFNGDANVDLVTANRSSNSISVLLGNGNGTFAFKTDYSVGVGPVSLALAQLVGNPNLDLVVVHQSSTVSILQGQSNGVFGPRSDMNVQTDIGGLAVGDFNSDNLPDLAMTHSGNAKVGIHLGDGAGSFPSTRVVATGERPKGISVDDFNGDGFIDLAVANSQSGTLSLHSGDGTGKFERHVSLQAQSPSALLVHDLDLDGKQDIVSSAVSTHVGYGNGFFDSPTHYGGAGSDLALADLNLDGILDLAIPHPEHSPSGIGEVAVYFGVGQGLFSLPTNFPTSSSKGIAIGDLNDDGLQDVVVGGNDQVTVLLGEPMTLLATPDWWYVNVDVVSVALAEMNGDAELDLILAGDDGTYMLFGHGDGTFAEKIEITNANSRGDLVVSDLNGDLHPDVLVGSLQSAFVLWGSGDDSFTRSVYPAGPWCRSVAAGDLDGDGLLDLLVGSYLGNHVSWLRNLGSGSFAPPIAFGVDGGPWDVSVADVNADQVLDVVVAARDAGRISVLLNRRLAQVDVPPARGSRMLLSLASANPGRKPFVIEFELEDESEAELSMFDIRGRRVWHERQVGMGAGRHRKKIDSKQGLAPGLYFIRLDQAGRSLTRKVTVLP